MRNYGQVRGKRYGVSYKAPEPTCKLPAKKLCKACGWYKPIENFKKEGQVLKTCAECRSYHAEYTHNHRLNYMREYMRSYRAKRVTS